MSCSISRSMKTSHYGDISTLSELCRLCLHLHWYLKECSSRSQLTRTSAWTSFTSGLPSQFWCNLSFWEKLNRVLPRTTLPHQMQDDHSCSDTS
ncbi:hypothetical protein Mapa_007150 [Marchantia paleacea]|nr:hypothetical protein Mapa_007150 [Marchantia paleacea]